MLASKLSLATQRMDSPGLASLASLPLPVLLLLLLDEDFSASA